MLIGILAGSVAGLLLGRLAIELGGAPLRLRWVLALAALCAVLGGGAGAWGLGRRERHSPWALTLPALYLLWPEPEPTFGLALLGAALALSLAPRLSGTARRPWMEGAILLGFGALYGRTLAPGLLPADSGEFQLVAGVLGIAHPPGYALYTLLGKLSAFIPIGDVAYRLNLFGAACGVLTLVALARLIRRSEGHIGAALVAVCMLGLSATFWAQSTTANIRSLTALFTALCLWSLMRWADTRSDHHLIAFAVAFGLGVGHHASLGLLAPAFALFIAVSEPRLFIQPRRWIAPAVALALSLLVLLYLPLRSAMQPAFDPSPIRTWADFRGHVLASGFRGDMFHYRTWETIQPRLGIWWQIMRLQFGPVLPWAMLLAWGVALMRRCRLALLVGGAWALNTLTAVTYRAPQTVEYLIPSYVALAACLGLGLSLLPELLPRRRAQLMPILHVALLAVIALYAAPNYDSMCELHRDTEARDYAEAVLSAAPTNAVILSSWHRATPFWYLQLIEGLRRDVSVQYVYPEGALSNDQVWLRRVGEALAERPVLVTNRFESFGASDYRWVPLEGAWLVTNAPLETIPEAYTPLERDLGDQVRVLGYTLEAETLKPGEMVNARIYWTPLRPLERDYATFVQLLGPRGVMGQGDIQQRSSAYLPGEVRVDSYRFPLLLHTHPGNYELITGFYAASEQGWERLSAGDQDHVPFATLSVAPSASPSATLHPMRIHYAGGLTLRGADYDKGAPGQTRLYLHWWQRTAAGGAPYRVAAWQGDRLLAEGEVPPLTAGQGAIVALDLPGDVMSVDLRLTDASGNAVPRLRAWQRATSQPVRLSVPAGSARYVPLGGEMAFIGWRAVPEQAVSGEMLRLQPRFLALRPLVHDYSVSLGFENTTDGWEVKSDGTPALGAIPTLKWLRGWQVEDSRRLTVPQDAGGPGTLTLSVYEAFTLEPLQVLDERLVREGQGTTLRLESLPVEER
jgi:hypothetical protein